MFGDDDGPPPARSARVRPTRQSDEPSKRRERMDPRFDPMFGEPNRAFVESHYKFVQEREEEEERERRFRIRCLKCVLRRFELEEAGADTTEYDFTDDEEQVFGDDHREDLALLKLTPTPHIRRELEELKRASQLYTARHKDKAANRRRSEVKKNIMKKEVKAVRDGVKSKPYFPKRRELKKAELADTYDRLEEKGGQAAVNRYVARKGMRN